MNIRKGKMLDFILATTPKPASCPVLLDFLLYFFPLLYVHTPIESDRLGYKENRPDDRK